MNLKRISISFVVALMAIVALASAQNVFAGSAYNAAFTTSITYQNVGAGTANIVFTFFNENSGADIPYDPDPLPKDAGGSLYVGNVSGLSSGFSGSAVMSSDEPVVATLVQISGDADVKNRPLSNGFSNGSSTVLLATALKNQFGTTSRFSIQNADTTAVDLSVKIYDANNPIAAPKVVPHNNLPVGAAKYFDMGTLGQITSSSFNGSVVVTAVESGTSTPADIVGTVLEMSTSGGAVSAFEGVPQGSDTVYMPSALCNAFGATSFYAIQNTDTTKAKVTITYSNNLSESKTIDPGAKASVNSCDVLSAGFSGSATITAHKSGAPSTPADIIVIGKVSGSGISSAFLGDSSGADKLALPYVRFTQANWNNGSRQRAYIAVQNVGNGLGSGQVTLKYVDRNGKLIATHALGAMSEGQKLNSNPSDPNLVLAAGATQAELDEFGYVGGFGAGVIIEGPSGSELVAVTRIVSKTSSGQVGEDYNGIPIP